jgi:hypothetical protein
MKGTWYRLPLTVKNLKKCEMVLSSLNSGDNEKRRNEIFYEYSRSIEGSYSETNELLRRLNNLFPPSELIPIHNKLKDFMKTLISVERNLLEYIRKEDKKYLDRTSQKLLKCKKMLEEFPTPDSNPYESIFGYGKKGNKTNDFFSIDDL